MPKFEKGPEKKTSRPLPPQTLSPVPRKQKIPQVTVAQCHVCVSPHRDQIEQAIARGMAYSAISELTGGAIDRRSISNHAQKHLNYEKAVIQKIIDREADRMNELVEEGVHGKLKRKVWLETALQKGLDALVDDQILVMPKDVLAIIQQLDMYDAQIEGASLDRYQAQFDAFMQAMNEIVPAEYLRQVTERTRQIIDSTAVEITEVPEIEEGDE